MPDPSAPETLDGLFARAERFAQILPPQAPTPQIQAHAQKLLALIGITDTSLYADPGDN